MKETLYRRNQDGMMTEVVPEARGKAAAADRWLAQSGNLNPKTGKYTEGPLKGKTYDQGKQRFEVMWASATESVKEGYASHARNGATASERQVAGVQPTPPKDMSPKAIQIRRMAAYGHEFNANGDAVPINRSKPAPAPAPKAGEQGSPSGTATSQVVTPAGKGDLTQEALGSPEEQAQVLAQVQQGSEFGTATVGNYLNMQAAVSYGKKLTGVDSYKNDQKLIAERAAIEKKAAEKEASERSELNTQRAAAGMPIYDKEGKLIAPDSPPKLAGSSPVPPNGIPPMLQRPAPEVAKPAMSTPELTGNRLIPGSAPKGINPLTKLPFGYQPGDVQAEGGPVLDQAAAGASIHRQEQAQSIANSDRIANQVIPKARFAPLRDQHKAAMSDYRESENPEDYKKVKEIYDKGTDLDRAQIIGDSFRHDAEVMKSFPNRVDGTATPESSRVVASRPATQEELRTNTVGTGGGLTISKKPLAGSRPAFARR